MRLVNRYIPTETSFVDTFFRRRLYIQGDPFNIDLDSLRVRVTKSVTKKGTFFRPLLIGPLCCTYIDDNRIITKGLYLI